jgi:hypothetical protein
LAILKDEAAEAKDMATAAARCAERSTKSANEAAELALRIAKAVKKAESEKAVEEASLLQLNMDCGIVDSVDREREDLFNVQVDSDCEMLDNDNLQ